MVNKKLNKKFFWKILKNFEKKFSKNFWKFQDAINKFDGGTRQVYGTKATAHIFASYSSPHLGVFNGFIDQVIATAVFCLLIAHITDKRNHYPTWVQPFLVGTSFVLVGTSFAYNAG